MRRARALAVLAILGLTATGCGGKDDFDVRGQLTLDGSGISAIGSTNNAGEPCEGTDGYDDITEGVQVVIRNADGKKVALGELGSGKLAEDGDESSNGPCVFKFKVAGVPGGSKIYSVEVSHRGEINFKQSDAQTLSLTLGG